MFEFIMEYLNGIIDYLEHLIPHFTLIFTTILYIVKFKQRISKIATLLKVIIIVCIIIIIYQIITNIFGIQLF